jgi:hypothetical protein
MKRRTTLILIAALWAGTAALLCAQPGGHDAASKPANASPLAAGPEAKQPGPAALITEQQETELLNALAEKRPEEASRLRRMKEENPRAYRAALHTAWRAYQVWKDLPPEMQKLQDVQARARLDAWRLVKELRGARDPADKERLRARLHEALAAEFAAEQAIREYRLDQLEEQLKRLRAEVKERADNRAQFIEKSIDDLLAGRNRALQPEGRPFAPVLGTRPFAAPSASRPAEHPSSHDAAK